MPPGKKPITCIPCAKRKVRCDKGQPCSNCNRRKNDVCAYPIQRTTGGERHSEKSAQRIERLESEVRRLRGDLQLAKQIVESGNVDTQEKNTRSSSTKANSLGNTTPAKTTEIGRPAGLVEHNEQMTCIEIPMWYSWSGAKKSEREQQDSSPNPRNLPKPKSKISHYFFALLDSTDTPDSNYLCALHPLATEGILLWKQYLKNVHPLIMIFFDWEIEAVIQKASYDPASLAPGEQALVFAIYFIAALSLSEEQCIDLLHSNRIQQLETFQKAVEESLVIAEFVVTSDRFVLQAFMLYLLAMRNRARPAALHSLMGIASRIAERMGLQHDGDRLGISALRAEERRRMWWQLQHMEVDMGLLTGNISMTIYSDWDTKLPRNLEDRDLHPDIQNMPPGQRGLTNISHCLWRYQILHMQRDTRQLDGGVKKALPWMLSPQVSLAEKDAMIDICEQTLGEQFLQYCEPLNPLHIHIQIGVRLMLLAARRVARQPALVNVKISEMSPHEREEFLRICTKCLDYYLLSETTESLRGFRWHNENYFPWPAFVYIILEAHHRFDNDTVEELWLLIGKVYTHHPTLMTAVSRPDIASIARIALVAWQRRHTYVQQQYQQRCNTDLLNKPEVPSWVGELRQKLDLPQVDPMPAPDATAQEPAFDASQLLPLDFDFDVIDWTFWETSHADATLYGMKNLMFWKDIQHMSVQYQRRSGSSI